jgi:VWFA-related protein
LSRFCVLILRSGDEMHLSNRLCIALIASALLPVGLFAQQAPALQTAPKAAEEGGRIRLDVSVTTKSGEPVTGLQQQDLTLLDNKQPEPITSFRALADSHEPLRVILVIDSVNTSFQTVAYERTQMDQFLHANEGRLAAPTTLVVLSDKGAQVQNGYTQDGNALAQAFDKYTIGLRSITRSAGFYGAGERLQISVEALRQLAAREATEPGRKIILWISPGWPILSGPGVQLDAKQEQSIFDEVVSLSRQLRQERLTLYNINPLGANEGVGRTFYYAGYLEGVTKPSQTALGDLSLQVLAIHSGGLVLSSSGIAEMMQRCLKDAQNAYELTFVAPPNEKPLEYHTLEVKVDRPGATARTTAGYYSQTQ